jgi:Zn-finger nucleic acid-binding protein
LGEFVVGSCTSCKGFWLDGVGLFELVRATDAELGKLAAVDSGEPQDGPNETISCPRCRRPMTREVGGSGIALDSCSRHGVWFDRGELQALIEYVGVPIGDDANKRSGVLGWLRDLVS